MLLRSLQQNDLAARAKFFADVRACRRRKRTPVDRTSLAQIMSTPDEYELLECKASILRVRALIHKKGMLALDAFSAFNVSRNGLLTCSELNGGLYWLGLVLQPAQVHSIVRAIDRDNDGLVSFDDFELAFGQSTPTAEDVTADAPAALLGRSVPLTRTLSRSDSGGVAAAMAGSHYPAVTVEPRPIPELHTPENSEEAKHAQIDLPDDVVRHCRASVVLHTEFTEVWKSDGLATNVGVWGPNIGTSFMSKNRVRISLGHYAQRGLESPALDTRHELGGRLTLELHDTKGTGLSGSKHLATVLAQFCPTPLRFKQVWYKRLDAKGSLPLFVWRAVPPSAKFVALGMVATTTDDPPSRDSIRCVPKAWCVESEVLPQLIWEDSGTGGRPGSLWALRADPRNESGDVVLDGARGVIDAMVATPGHDPPGRHAHTKTNRVYQLRRKQFFIKPEGALQSFRLFFTVLPY